MIQSGIAGQNCTYSSSTHIGTATFCPVAGASLFRLVNSADHRGLFAFGELAILAQQLNQGISKVKITFNVTEIQLSIVCKTIFNHKSM